MENEENTINSGQDSNNSNTVEELKFKEKVIPWIKTPIFYLGLYLLIGFIVFIIVTTIISQSTFLILTLDSFSFMISLLIFNLLFGSLFGFSIQFFGFISQKAKKVSRIIIMILLCPIYSIS